MAVGSGFEDQLLKLSHEQHHQAEEEAVDQRKKKPLSFPLPVPKVREIPNLPPKMVLIKKKKRKKVALDSSVRLDLEI